MHTSLTFKIQIAKQRWDSSLQCNNITVCQMRANKYKKINELMPDIKMSSANAFVSHAINSAFIPQPVPLCHIVDYKEKYIHKIKQRIKTFYQSL